MGYSIHRDRVDHLFLQAFDRCNDITLKLVHDQWVLARLDCSHGQWEATSDGLVQGFSQATQRAVEKMLAAHPASGNG